MEREELFVVFGETGGPTVCRSRVSAVRCIEGHLKGKKLSEISRMKLGEFLDERLDAAVVFDDDDWYVGRILRGKEA